MAKSVSADAAVRTPAFRDEESSGVLPPTEAELVPLDTEAVYGPIKDTVPANEDGELTGDDMLSFVGSAISDSRLVGNSLDSFNRLVESGIKEIVTRMFRVDITSRNMRQSEGNDQISHYNIMVDFLNAEIGKPVRATYPSGQMTNHYPSQARKTGASYSGPLVMESRVEIVAHYHDGRTESKSAEIPRFEVSQFPIMVGSKKCHTYNLTTREARKRLQEDPRELGGYFLVKGEWTVELLENIRFNSLHVYLNLPKEQVRGEFISQPGGAFENSSQIIIRLLQNGQITIEVNSMKFQRLQIPFYLIFRLFGMVSDVDILQQIVGDLNSASPVDRAMIDIVDRALHLASPMFEGLKDELDRQTIIEKMAVSLERFVTNPQSYKSDEDAIRYLTTRLLSIMDMVFLPHVGQKPGSRIQKLRFLGMLMRKVLLVQQGVAPPADRDSFTMKRVHGSGVSLAKTFKAMFNSAVVSVIVNSLKNELKQTDFAKLTPRRIQEASRTMFTASSELSRLLNQSLTSGNKIIVVRRRSLMNRLASNALERKNRLNLVSSLRRISAHNANNATKGTERAELIRAVHSSALGYACPYHSADTGEKVGMEKQMACTANVCDSGETYPLLARLAGDPFVIPLTRVSATEINRRHLARIFVNGNWVGCCETPHEFIARYRGMRRRGEGVTPHTTISWKLETNEVEFWLDVGRLTRPLIIVDNNQEEFDAAARKAFEAKKAGDSDWEKHKIQFVQNVRFTKQHAQGILAGRVTLKDLVREGVCEWVAPEEMENCLLAEDIDHLRANRHNVLRPYTHCDVPQALSGMAALVSPFANHTQPARVTYETNQGRSTCGWYCFSWPFRADQLRFLQFYNQNPLIRTLSHNYILPNGMNTFIAYMTWGGDNQEDSAIVSQDFIQRGGFAGMLFRKEVVTLEGGEHFGSPDATSTRGMKSGASYANLVDGFPPRGSLIKKGDVVIGRIAKEAPESGSRSRSRGGMPASATAAYVDRSIVYRDDEPARVDQVWSTRGPDDSTFALVKLRFFEKLNIGGKMSSRSGNKGIVSAAYPACDLPYDAQGNRPDIIINPHSIPSRMVIGQNIEAYLGMICARTGTSMDGTIFRSPDVASYEGVMKRLGFRGNGYTGTMIHPRTGEHLANAVFMGPTYQQRLQKFVDLNRYPAPPSGPTDALTGQPLDGKKAHGGLRVGEMEVWVLCANGLMRTLGQKIRADSDGCSAYYCRDCGCAAVYNQEVSIYSCANCGDMADIAEVPSCKASIVFQQELQAMGIDMRVQLGERLYESSTEFA